MLRTKATIVAGFILFIAVPPAWADVIVKIPALQDATLFGGSAANNSSSGPGMFVGSDGQGRPKRGLIEFDIPAYVPSGATITSAVLTLYLGQVAGSGGGRSDQTPRAIRLYDVMTAWAGGTNGTTGFPGPGFGETGVGFPANIGDATPTTIGSSRTTVRRFKPRFGHFIREKERSSRVCRNTRRILSSAIWYLRRSRPP